MRLSGISRIIEAEVGVIFRSRRLRQITLTELALELFIFHSLYELFFGIILFYSLCENKKPDLLVLQTIIRKRDVIIAEYQELFVDVTS